MTGAAGSGWVCTAAVEERGAARTPAAASRSSAEPKRLEGRSLIFITGPWWKVAARGATAMTGLLRCLPARAAPGYLLDLMSAPEVVSVFSKDNPFPARMAENRLLTKPGSGKETRHFVVELTGSGLHYKAGDSLGIFPSNRPSEVEEILRRLGASGEEPVMLPKAAAAVSLREALGSRLSLNGPTRKI